MNVEDFNGLLQETYSIYIKHQDLLDKSGERFNIFNILNLRTNEVRTHSAFLAELLNPKGSHGQKELFLEIFIKQLNINDFKCINAKVEVEKNIGGISVDKEDGGGIDIIITDVERRSVIIENKIYAEDQYNQLLRYANYGKSNCKKFSLLYLTLFGNEASDSSKQSLRKQDYIRISYSEDIILWLDECYKRSRHIPFVSDTIKQYTILLKQLTNQSTDQVMKNELVQMISSSDKNIKALFEIQKQDIIGSVKNNLIEKFKIQLSELAEEKGLAFFVDGDFNSEVSYFTFKLKESKKGFYISFGFHRNYSNTFYVVNCADKFVEECRDDVCKLLGKRDKGFNEIWIKFFGGELSNWSNSVEPWLNILDGTLKTVFDENITFVLAKLEGYDI